MHKGFPLLAQAAKRRMNSVQKHFVDLEGGAFLAVSSSRVAGNILFQIEKSFSYASLKFK